MLNKLNLYSRRVIMYLEYSHKARRKLRDEGVSETEIVDCVNKGSKIINKDKTIIARYGYLTVVYKKKRYGTFVISLWTGDKEYKAR